LAIISLSLYVGLKDDGFKDNVKVDGLQLPEIRDYYKKTIEK
jgi:hypothetical protein